MKTTVSARRFGRKRISAVVAVVALLLGANAVATVAGPASAAVPHAVQGEAAAVSSAVPQASTLPAETGMTVPAGKNEVAADVLGLGYEQVVRLNESKVEVVDPVTRGSQVLRSFEVGATREWPKNGLGSVFYGGSNMTEKVAGHSASRLAVAGRHIYVSNLLTRMETDHSDKRIVMPNGSELKKYNADGALLDQRRETDLSLAITAMDGFVWKGEEYLAVGYNMFGVRIVKPALAGMPNDDSTLLWHWSGPHRLGGETVPRDQIIEVKLGTGVDGRLLLAAGAVTQELPALAMLDVHAKQGEEELWTKNFRPHTEGWEWPEVVAFGKLGAEGRPHVAVGWPTLGRVTFYDATTGVERGALGGGVVSVIRFFTDAAGEYRVGIRRGVGYDFTSHVARLDASGAPVIVEDGEADALEWMVPGYRVASMHVENRSRAEISVKTYSGATRVRGCWYAAELKGASPTLPKQPVRIAPGGKAGPFASAWRTVGEQCFASDVGVVYLQVDLPGEPGHRRIVQLQGDKDGVRVREQVGSDRLSVRVEPRDPVADGPFGLRLVVSDTYAAPTVAGIPKLEAARLTPAPAEGYIPTEKVDDPSRPVHRLTVSDVSWTVPGAATDLTEAVLPLPFAEGSVDGRTWHRLGTVASPVAPTRDGDRVTMGPGVFDWQTPPGAANDYRYLRVTAGGAISNVVDLSELAAPAPTTLVEGVSIVAGGAARANGLDQAPMRVSLVDHDLREMDAAAHAELYDRIYYRDGLTKALITGLGDPNDPSQLVMFSLRPGQYANEGAAASTTTAATTSIGAYFSSRSMQPGRQVRATFKHNAVKPDALDGSAPFTPLTNLLSPSRESTGAVGVGVDTCTEGLCAIADPSVAPALHSLSSTSISVQFRAIAVPGGASLPLTAPNTPGELLTVAEDTFEISGSRATLRNPGVFGYNATISGQVISHGERVVFENLYV